MMSQTTILLVDDHAMLRKGLRMLIEQEEGLCVIGEASNGREAIAQLRQDAPDIVVMDINMPDINGIEATRQIISDSPNTRILALSIHSGQTYVEEMLEAGAAGYLLKESAPEELIKAIHALKEGKGYLSADITDIVLSRLRQVRSAGDAPGGRSRERRLASKLMKPELPEKIVHRQELLKQLDLWRDRKLTLVVAPAGYGKSTLVCDWLNHSPEPNAWLSLDSSDNDLRQFLGSLIAALRRLFPAACRHLQILVDAANLPPCTMLAGALIADLEKLPQPFILALDDMHLVKVKTVYDFLSQIISHPFRSMHLVIIGRQDPFLPLSTLRGVKDLSEIRTQALQFSQQEITLFLELAHEKIIEPKIAATWLERTNGWVTGLQLATHQLDATDINESAMAEAEVTGDWRDLLTNREYDILLLLERRLRDKEIASQLCVSKETVKSHLKNIYVKLSATDRRDAIIKAKQLEILK